MTVLSSFLANIFENAPILYYNDIGSIVFALAHLCFHNCGLIFFLPALGFYFGDFTSICFTPRASLFYSNFTFSSCLWCTTIILAKNIFLLRRNCPILMLAKRFSCLRRNCILVILPQISCARGEHEQLSSCNLKMDL